MKKLNAKLLEIKTNVKYALNNKEGASMWEYLLIIAIVVIVGGVFLNVLTGQNGQPGVIERIWTALETKIMQLFQL